MDVSLTTIAIDIYWDGRLFDGPVESCTKSCQRFSLEAIAPNKPFCFFETALILGERKANSQEFEETPKIS